MGEEGVVLVEEGRRLAVDLAVGEEDGGVDGVLGGGGWGGEAGVAWDV